MPFAAQDESHGEFYRRDFSGGETGEGSACSLNGVAKNYSRIVRRRRRRVNRDSVSGAVDVSEMSENFLARTLASKNLRNEKVLLLRWFVVRADGRRCGQ
jgi:hypothetical protein